MKKEKGPQISSGSSEGRRNAAAVLEVLAGVRTPAQAAEALRISLPRYYVLETKALEAMVTACEPRPAGRTPSSGKMLERLQSENQRLQRDLERHKSLARVAQRTIGLAAPVAPAGKKRKRRPAVRALRAARVLASEGPFKEGGTNGAADPGIPLGGEPGGLGGGQTEAAGDP